MATASRRIVQKTCMQFISRYLGGELTFCATDIVLKEISAFGLSQTRSKRAAASFTTAQRPEVPSFWQLLAATHQLALPQSIGVSIQIKQF